MWGFKERLKEEKKKKKEKTSRSIKDRRERIVKGNYSKDWFRKDRYIRENNSESTFGQWGHIFSNKLRICKKEV